ncbi:PEP-CTERM/exosortase system-associated acyltransferase [Rhodopila sp.]|uniref:PEP-CTERM/exosortase system-associated acyltransferase n=1 Tax=Rhodopila sp. TaxID=2480087 RepID=UPI002BC61FF9|nr:PEP-CTERM/exosortase system-associated acyltransferase [Rhodopila sp.]HVZ10184.1 PEP-CTERM/exosortase system-associated acyltransferase [Rhodopila sp.]
MDKTALRDAIDRLTQDISVELADTAAALQEAYRLRHQVYCQDHAFLQGVGGLETDEFDSHARHALIRWRPTGQAIGTIRLVLPQTDEGEDDFPIEQACSDLILDGFPRVRTGEVSRFALSKQHVAAIRETDPDMAGLLRLALLQGALWMSAEAGHTHWLAIMQPTLLRLLRGDGLRFRPLGPLVEYHGKRQPVLAHLDTMLAGAANEQPAVWAYLTRGGTLFSGRGGSDLRMPDGALAAPGRRWVGLAMQGFAG